MWRTLASAIRFGRLDSRSGAADLPAKCHIRTFQRTCTEAIQGSISLDGSDVVGRTFRLGSIFEPCGWVQDLVVSTVFRWPESSGGVTVNRAKLNVVGTTARTGSP